MVDVVRRVTFGAVVGTLLVVVAGLGPGDGAFLPPGGDSPESVTTFSGGAGTAIGTALDDTDFRIENASGAAASAPYPDSGSTTAIA